MTPALPPRSSGRFVRVAQALPTIEVDFSKVPRQSAPRCAGKVERVCQPPPTVEGGTLEPADVFLEIIFTLAAEADSSRVLEKVAKVLESADAYERSSGGAGMTFDREQSNVQPGTLRLVCVPNNPTNAEHHLQTLAKLIVGAAKEFPMVNAVLARGCKHSEPYLPMFEVREPAA